MEEEPALAEAATALEMALAEDRPIAAGGAAPAAAAGGPPGRVLCVPVV